MRIASLFLPASRFLAASLLLAASIALVRFTRRAQALASAQMQFLAGVSHELVR